jgi:hypothetical protein
VAVRLARRPEFLAHLSKLTIELFPAMSFVLLSRVSSPRLITQTQVNRNTFAASPIQSPRLQV